MNLKNLFSFIPEVRSPEEKKVSFNIKLKWTLIVLGAFFVLANVSLFGLSENALQRFEYLAIILGTDFGSIISLGVGPIVMASIILQLLVGSELLNIDTSTDEGKKFFTGLQKLLVLFFIIFEAMVYVLMGGLQALPGFTSLVILQLVLGGLAIFYMDDLLQKWGFGSGISLFIAAGVSWRLITSAFQFVNQQGQNCLLDFGNTACSGRVLVMVQSLISNPPDKAGFLSAAAALVATVLIFLIVVWAQSLKVEVPLSYGRLRGYSVKWPLSFFYASVMPVILTAALIANFQLFGSFIESGASACINDNFLIDRTLEACSGFPRILSYFTFFGRFSSGTAISGLAFWAGSNNLLELTIRGALSTKYFLQGITHVVLFVLLSTLFALFWVKTSGLDSKSQAHKLASSGLHLAGFRQDERVLESILDRYILPLTIMGGVGIGLLASVTNLLGALVSGTAILLVIMITSQLYQQIAEQHAVDMHPAIRNFMS